MPEKARERPGAGGSAGRVIAGVARGRRLAAPGAGTRPIGDRVKQSLFAILEPVFRDGTFLDLFAGSGAAGIEALSRGAREVVFVEHSRPVGQYIERNLRTASLEGPGARVVIADATTWLAGPAAAGSFDALVLDPPYDQPQLADRSLEAIANAGPGAVLGAGGIAVVKHGRRTPPKPKVGLLRSFREERFGETTLTFYRWSAADEGEEVG